VPAYKFTPYLENEVLRKRPYLTKEMCIRVIESPIRSEAQEQDRPASRPKGSRLTNQLGRPASSITLLLRQ